MRLSKGQLISKCLFGVFNYFQKTNKNKSTWGTIVVKSNSFVRFLEETSAWKYHFDFVWPLVPSTTDRAPTDKMSISLNKLNYPELEHHTVMTFWMKKITTGLSHPIKQCVCRCWVVAFFTTREVICLHVKVDKRKKGSYRGRSTSNNTQEKADFFTTWKLGRGLSYSERKLQR